MNTLSDYKKKRNFDITSEPEARLVDAATDRLSFVVQLHDATRLHYDFRLEHGGVLWSWAVTRGPSMDPADKRLAVRTEDHPLDYRDFEGTIPKGQYGGGTVLLWDKGWWEPLHDPAKGLSEGKLHFRLHGARMKGGWALVRMHGKEKRENWLLIKERDEQAQEDGDALTPKNPKSVTTGRTLKGIATNADRAKPPAAMEEKAKPHAKSTPAFRPLQLATLRDVPPDGDDWRHEAKFDGYRCLMAIGKQGIRLYSRNGNDWSDRFGDLCAPAAALDCDAALIDGEVIAGDAGGNFSALQDALKNGGELTFYAFDCLHIDGKNLSREPLTERRTALEKLMQGQPPRGKIRLSPFIEGSGPDVLAAICKAGGEGIVSKRADAPYHGGRGTAWIKTKCTRRAEFVIIGWSKSDKPGRPFASLLLGSTEHGELVYRGRVGTGFDDDDFAELTAAMKPLTRKTAPVQGELPPETRGAHWIKPDLVAEIAYTEFTVEGRVRHGVYHGLREDKEASSVTAKAETEAEGLTLRGVSVSHPGRVVYPSPKITKGDVAEHYDRVADRLLIHAAHHPVSLLRCPAGVTGECFFQKHAGKGFPAAISTMPIIEKDGSVEDYMVLDDAKSLLGAVQMGTLEFHIWGAARDKLEQPDRMVFDLDPDEGLSFDKVRKSAQDIRAALADIGLESGAMVTGGKGIHVIVPLRRSAEWQTVKTFAQTFAHILAEREPRRYTATMAKAKRKGKIFIDWMRNERGSTAIAPYALRARTGAPVAVPVTWDELDSIKAANAFRIKDIAERLDSPCPLTEISRSAITKGVIAKLEAWAKD